MADKVVVGERRPSFRKSLAEARSTLPAQYLDVLEQKRKALDESIHKYIASKEREYKLFEKDLRQQYRTAPRDTDVPGGQRRRTSSESTTHTHDIAAGGASLSAVDTLLSKSTRRDVEDVAVGQDKERVGERAATTSLKDPEASVERDKDFLGLFMPQFLPALDSQAASSSAPGSLERTASAPPPAMRNGNAKHDLNIPAEAIPRASSDTAMHAAPAKRPAHLQNSQRTSSSESSVDGRLVSAMKSPAQQHGSSRPKRKRVSLAVGDSIVAPSDNVPVPMTNNKTASHSRTRSPASERDTASNGRRSPLSIEKNSQAMTSLSLSESEQNPGPVEGNARSIEATSKQHNVNHTAPTQTPESKPSPNRPTEDIGDMWHLEDPDSTELETEQIEGVDFEDHLGNEVVGRVGSTERVQSVPSVAPNESFDQSDEPTPAGEESDGVTHIEFRPESVASQQPTRPGFRRPSVQADPIYPGKDYRTAERDTEELEIYGSSFVRPQKASFTGGSLGESYMARHAEQMMRSRAQEQQPSQDRRVPPVPS